ncbi:MAG: DUF86 domain-containing protein [Melioribacteraceae bacterium]|nr:DUF86 domain-containing protein [Melioribacteraceae bacterium]MCF8356094.1 DUF86 domain-containing protein [Melioribacteraceae bacterium]MCF8395549.1 DUF86 domain-containing protein [Melioribacteraceae bacterium]MCF8420621.1 DUF86 domain-containing protein [Melioribacteraceae bacterium]
MNYAFERISLLAPLTKEQLEKLSNDDIAHIDQLIYRFSKLQDSIGQKLFKSILFTLDEQVSDKAAIDIFNRLEQLGIIEDYDKWKELRELRNELAHEYEEDLNETAEKLNSLLNRKSDLENYFNDIVKYIEVRKLI